MRISLDTETTGVDFCHGAKPFIVTICSDNGTPPLVWEWDVDPRTRNVNVVGMELDHIMEIIGDADEIVLQNSKFDVRALATIGITEWPWRKTVDTLTAGHLLASNYPHDLTSMALQYLGWDIKPFEQQLEEHVKAARRLIQQAKLKVRRDLDAAHNLDIPGSIATYTGEMVNIPLLSLFKIAVEGISEMPSAGQGCWRYDYWLPRAVAIALSYPEDHPWRTVVRDYASVDGEATLALWGEMEKIIGKRSLRAIYDNTAKINPIIAKMESIGVTYSSDRLIQLRQEYRTESTRLGNLMTDLASDVGLDLTLPKSGNNKSLLSAALVMLETSGVPTHEFRTPSGQLSLGKESLETYCNLVDPHLSQFQFFDSLRMKRKRDTGALYLDGYEEYGLPFLDVNGNPISGWGILHPSLNATGTGTLRCSSSHPNSQNIEKQSVDGHSLRWCFGPAPGREWWSLDAQNIELRIPAYESGEQALIELFEHPNDPPFYGSTHLLNFSVVYPDLWEQELKEVGLDRVGPHCKKKYAASWYQWCKNGGFAVQYGAVDRDDGEGTADRAFHRKGSHAKLKARFSKLEKLNRYWIDYAEKHGYVETMPDKTVDPHRGYPIMCTRTEWGKIMPTVPLNYHVQSTAMQWTRKAMIRVQFKLDNWNRIVLATAPRSLTPVGLRHWTFMNSYYMIMQVHDELVFDFPKRADPRLDPAKSNLGRIRLIQQIMASGGDDIGVPTPVGVEYHPSNWGEGITI